MFLNHAIIIPLTLQAVLVTIPTLHVMRTPMSLEEVLAGIPILHVI